MRSAQALSSQITLLLLFLPAAAHCQVFTVPANPFPREPGGAPAREEKVDAAVYLAIWEFAPIQSGSFRQTVQTDLSPLLTIDYSVTPRVSLGGWWNPFSGEFRASLLPGRPETKIADTDSSFWDVHAAYRLTRRRANNWSVQIGFSHLRRKVSYVPAFTMFGARDFAANSSSFDLWLNTSRQVGVRRLRSQLQPISLFGSIGYYPSSQFQHAANLIIGGTLPLSRQLSLSSSGWFNDFDHLNTRVTVGIAGQF